MRFSDKVEIAEQSASDHGCTVCMALHLPKKLRGSPRAAANWCFRVLTAPMTHEGFVKCVPRRLHGDLWAADLGEPGQ